MPSAPLAVGFLDDLIRSEFAPARRFFFDLVSSAIHTGTSVPVVRLSTDDAALLRHYGFDLDRWYAELGLKSGYIAEEDWIARYFRIPDTARQRAVDLCVRFDVVFTYEAPAWLTAALADADCVHLDLRLASLRFLPDLLVAVRCHQPAIREALRGRMVHDCEIMHEASLFAASLRHARLLCPLLPDGSLLLLGQLRGDASLIDSSGKALTFHDFREQLAALCDSSAAVYYKPHPFASRWQNEDDFQLLRKIFQNVRPHNGNVYETFACSQDLRCCAISSGSVSEAACFGHQACYLFQPIYSWWSGDSNWPEDAYVHLHAHAFLSPATWRGILGAIADLPDCPGATLERPFMPNGLRFLHNVSWGYNEAVLQHSLYNRDATRFGLLAQPSFLSKWRARGRWLWTRFLK